MTHEPIPFQVHSRAPFGIRCTCGVTFESHGDLETMRACWDAYRDHWIKMMAPTRIDSRTHPGWVPDRHTMHWGKVMRKVRA